MTPKSKSQRVDSRPTDPDDVSSDEWFARYLLNAVLLVVLVLTAIGVALYLEYLHDWSKVPGAGFLMCLLVCPMLAGAALGLVLYAGVRLFLRPHTLGHIFVRLTFLVAHLCVFLVCADTIASTAATVLRSVGPSSAGTDPTAAWRAMASRNFPGSPGDAREDAPDESSFSPPSGMGVPGLWRPGGGPGSR